jgi:hypothetical protein
VDIGDLQFLRLGTGYLASVLRWSTNLLQRALADVATNDFRGKKHKGFHTLREAELYMEENGISEYPIVHGELPGGNLETLKCDTFYAVANGTKAGIYECY